MLYFEEQKFLNFYEALRIFSRHDCIWFNVSYEYATICLTNADCWSLTLLVSISIRLVTPSNHFVLSCPFSLKEGGEGHDRGWDGWMASPTQWTWVWASSGSWWWTGREAWRAVVHGVTKSQTPLSDWTEHWLPKSCIVSRFFTILYHV